MKKDSLVYTPEEQQEIVDLFTKELRKSFEINGYGMGTPLWMSLLFILKRFNRGNYYGTIVVKILGTSCNDAKESEVTHKLREFFSDLFSRHAD